MTIFGLVSSTKSRKNCPPKRNLTQPHVIIQCWWDCRFLGKIIKKASRKVDLHLLFNPFNSSGEELDPSIIEKTALVIPCYNEKENLSILLPQITTMYETLHIYLIDDGSTDGTREFILNFRKKFQTVHLLTREKKDGLGSAYMYAYQKILAETSHEFFIQMDGDGSHNPYFLQPILLTATSADVVIGSRYVNGISVLHWPLHRLLLSYLINLYYRIFTRIPIRDFTSGFKCFRRKVLESINFQKVSSDGFFFQVEMNVFASKLGFSIIEIPIIFLDRTHGTSKMDFRVLLETALLGAFLPFRTYDKPTH